MTDLRHTLFTGDAVQDSSLSAENARDANVALSEKLSAYTTVITYSAVGATTTSINLRCEFQPVAVVLLRAYADADPGALVAATPSLNFAWDSALMTAKIPEPSGLSAGVSYKLTFMIVR